METKISNTLHQWIPQTVSLLQNTADPEENLTDYLLLRKLAESYILKIDSDIPDELNNASEILNVINLLYQSGNQYVRNAIENEFLTVLSTEESTKNLKTHLNLFPAELRKGYIKTILNN